MQEGKKINLNFLIDCATIIMVAEDKMTTEERSKMFDKAWNHADVESQRKQHKGK